ncbi:MAG: hypothetical protein M3348_12670 [Acidobacteriota bacterium]|nr:hypothetical protein [Acidobacteriota bacterium]
MKLASIIKNFGKELGPLGVAVYAFIATNQKSTYGEIADGLGMGESTVKKCVRQFEELGIAERVIERTEKGLCLPTRIQTKDPGTIERGTSDNPLPDITPSPQNPVTIERVDSKGVILSDPGTIERGASGTPLAPYKAETTSEELAGRGKPRQPNTPCWPVLVSSSEPEPTARAAPKRRPVPCDEEYLAELQAEPAYQALNVAHVFSKMSAWCKARGKQPTRMRLINWLNREDQPMAVVSDQPARAAPSTASPERQRELAERYHAGGNHAAR